MALQREARKAQTLAHPNVVTVFDFDRDGDTVYMTMELLKGRSLDSIVREGRGEGNSAEIALPIIRGIAEGLAYAHRKGIVHSDLKPGNVFIASMAAREDSGLRHRARRAELDHRREQRRVRCGLARRVHRSVCDGRNGHGRRPAYRRTTCTRSASSRTSCVTGFHPYQRHSAPNARKLDIKPRAAEGTEA